MPDDLQLGPFVQSLHSLIGGEVSSGNSGTDSILFVCEEAGGSTYVIEVRTLIETNKLDLCLIRDKDENTSTKERKTVQCSKNPPVWASPQVVVVGMTGSRLGNKGTFP